MASILVVDDERDIQTLMATTLEVAGHNVVVASNGEEALAKLRKRRYDAVVLDIMMPLMNGYQVLEQIRSIPSRADTPVVVVTAKHDPDGLAKEVAFGIVDHVAKPFFPEELETAVERAVGSSEEAVDERRRVLTNDAEVYGSIRDLYVKVGDTV